MTPLAIGYLVGINLFALAAFGWDKRRARAGGRRLSERSLLALAAIGGSLGAVAGQQLFRHKTKKQPFAAILYSIIVGQAVALAVYFAR